MPDHDLGGVGAATDTPLPYTPGELIEKFRGRISRDNIYSAIRDGTIPSVRLGRRILLPRADVDKLFGI
jgi:excisionase family DNA binding protein